MKTIKRAIIDGFPYDLHNALVAKGVKCHLTPDLTGVYVDGFGRIDLDAGDHGEHAIEWHCDVTYVTTNELALRLEEVVEWVKAI